MQLTTLSLSAPDLWAPGVPDLRGWAVRDGDGNRAGRVHDLVVANGRVRYLDVDAGSLYHPKRVLLPVGLVELDAALRCVFVGAMSRREIFSLPDYDGDLGSIDFGFEREVCLRCPPNLGPTRLFGSTEAELWRVALAPRREEAAVAAHAEVEVSLPRNDERRPVDFPVLDRRSGRRRAGAAASTTTDSAPTARADAAR
jgi:hypothetical protein